MADDTATSYIALRELLSGLFRRNRFDPSLPTHYQIVDRILHGCNRRKFRPFSETKSWLLALQAAILLPLTAGHPFTEWPRVRDLMVTDAARRLRSRGYRLHIEGYQFAFDQGELERCCGDLEKLARQIGGRAIAEAIVVKLMKQHRYSFGRFLFPRQVPGWASNPPSMPTPAYGYLMNLAVRFMDSKTANQRNLQLMSELESLAGDLVAIFDLEDYSPYANMFSDHVALPLQLQRIMIGDSCLSVRQIIPMHALEMMRGIFSWADDEAMREKLGWTISDALKLAEATMVSTPPHLPVNLMIERSELPRKANLSSATLNGMLPSLMHRPAEVNAAFHTPTDASAITFDLKPFIWQPGNRLMLVSPPMCSVGFIEAMAAATRIAFDAPGSQVADIKIGQAIEAMLAGAFERRGITPSVVSKKFWIGKQHFDCDLAIECQAAILLFEIKKKALTKTAMGGQILDGLIDLSKAMMRAQTQLGRQEILLRKDGCIAFEDGTRLELRGRRIHRIAVTLLDWGGIQDRAVVNSALDILLNASLSSSAPELTADQVRGLKESNKYLSLLQLQRAELFGLGADKDRPWFDWLFLGVPQILFLLDGCRNAEGFLSNLRQVMTMSTAELDMYSVVSDWRNMGNKPNAARQSKQIVWMMPPRPPRGDIAN